jgi:hypothetical protein
MKKISLIILTAFVTMLAACYKDTGNYTYKEINEVRFSGIASKYSVLQGIDVLHIEPKIMPTEEISDPSRLSYYWILTTPSANIDTLGASPVLDTRVSALPGSYILYLRVVDKETGVAWKTGAELKVATRYSQGLMLMGTDENGNAEMDMITMSTDTMIAPRLLSISGLPVLKDPYAAIMTGRDTSRNYTRLWVMTKSGSYFLDRETMTGTTARNFGSISVTNEPGLDKATMTPMLYAPQVKERAGATSSTLGARVMMTTDGNIFPTHSFLVGGDYYINPVNRLAADFSTLLKPAPYFFYPINNMTSFMWYDMGNQRFMNYPSFGTATASIIPGDKSGDIFPWDQASVGRTFVYGENTRNTDGGSTNGNSFAIVKDNSNKFYIYKFYATGTSPIKRDFYQVNDAIATNFDKASLFAFSSKRTVVFYAVGNTLYAYDYNKGFEKSYTFSEIADEITMLKFDTQIDYVTNALYIATYNDGTKGRLRRYMVGTDPNSVLITPVDGSDWNGLIKVKSMNWRGLN